MEFTATDLILFWYAPWAAPLRAACVEPLAELPWPAPSPMPLAPKWPRPLFLQRLVGQAIATRVAGLKDHPWDMRCHFGNDSEPDWGPDATASYDLPCLHELREQSICWLWGMEMERLLRSMLTPPGEVGLMAWTRAVLGICEHFAQMYAEFKRRYKARRAREIVQAEVQRFLTNDYSEAA